MILSQKNISGNKQNGFCILFSFYPILLPLAFVFTLFSSGTGLAYNRNSFKSPNSSSVNTNSGYYYSVIPEIDINSLKQNNSILKNQNHPFNRNNFSVYYSIDEKLNFYNEITAKNPVNLLWNVLGTIFSPFDRNRDQGRGNDDGKDSQLKPYFKNLILQNYFNSAINKASLLSYHRSSSTKEDKKNIIIKSGLQRGINKTYLLIDSFSIPSCHKKSIIASATIRC